MKEWELDLLLAQGCGHLWLAMWSAQYLDWGWEL